LCHITADFVHFVYDTVSIRFTTTQINLCKYVLYLVMRELFLNKMLQKV